MKKLAVLIKKKRDSVVTRWRDQVRKLPSARTLDVAALTDHIPYLLDELAAALMSKSDQTISKTVAENIPPVRGLPHLKEAFNIEAVVAEYNLLRGSICCLADDHGMKLQGRPLHVINGFVDHAIGLVLQTYVTESALQMRRRREEYLAFVAHDLRTPLNAISLAEIALHETLSEKGICPDDAQMLRALRRNVEQLDFLVTKVLEENMHLQTELGMKLVRRQVDLWPLVESLVQGFQPAASIAGTRLVNQVPEGLIVYADAGVLRRLFQNLIANAIKYTPRGKVVIGARELGVDGVHECWVTDNGAGIPVELLKKIFEQGVTDPNNAGGMGFGLAIVKTAVEAHGGEVTAESQERVGSTFRFSLPGPASKSEPS